MQLNVRPIISALLRNWTGAFLVAMQVAIALAVLVNAVYVVKQRVDKIGRPSGMDVENIFTVRSQGFADDFNHEATIREDLAYIRSLPGVVAATSIDYLPMSDSGNRVGVMLKQGDQQNAVGTNYFEVDEHGLEALGVRLAAGRSFAESDVLPARIGENATKGVPVVIITQALANDLFPNGDALGKTMYDSFDLLAGPATIIGIVEHMHGSRVQWNRVDRVLLAPRLPWPDEPMSHYMVRTQPGQRDNVMRTVEEHLADSNAGRVIEWVRPLEFFRNRGYMADRNMGIFLTAITAMLLAITAVGIFGLATFNVSTRFKQIGTRRALGAQRLDIVSYFLIENWLVATVGVVVGCLLALAAGSYLAREYSLPRLDLYYLAGGIPILWILGLLAAWQPARRAAAVSPAVATRTV